MNSITSFMNDEEGSQIFKEFVKEKHQDRMEDLEKVYTSIEDETSSRNPSYHLDQFDRIF